MHNSSMARSDDLLVMDEEVKWNNEDNNAFYEAVKAEGLQQLAEKGGLASGCDMRILAPYWSNAHSILDVGAGYGRAIDYLLKHQFQGTITAVERCNVLFEYLKKKLDQNKNVNLLHSDIRYLTDINERFDLILMLWYGIADFSQEEQPHMFKKLKTLLKKGGQLIIDTIPENIIPIESKDCGKQNYLIKTINATIYVHLLNAGEIKKYARESGFSSVKQISYQTDIQRDRWLYILN